MPFFVIYRGKKWILLDILLEKLSKITKEGEKWLG